MIMAYYLRDQAPSMEELIKKYGIWLDKNNYQHKDYLKIVRDFGLSGFRKSWWVNPGAQPLINKFHAEGESEEEIAEWEQTNLEEGLFTIKKYIEKGIPVVASVNPEFSPSLSSHMIVVTGIEEDKLIIHDPLHKGANYQITEEEFKKYWLRQAIIIYPTHLAF